MANILENYLDNLADAIRLKTGGTADIEAMDFASEIKSIPQNTTGIFQEKEIELTTSGTTEVTPDTDYDAMTKVVVTPKLQDKIISLTSAETTTVTADAENVGLNSISVTPSLQSKTVSITSNTTTTITPDTGYCGLSDISITTNIPNSLTYKVIYQQGTADTTGSGSISIPAAKTQSYLIINAITQNDYSISVSGTGLTISRINTDTTGQPYTAVNNGYRYSTFIYNITKTAGTARTLSVSCGGNAIRYSCAVLVY